jgi:hypothetical protein
MSLQPDVPAASPERPAPIAANGPVVQASPIASPNGPGLGQASRLPRGKRAAKGARFIVPAVVLVLLLAGLGVWFFFFRGPTARTDLVFKQVERRARIQLKVIERGTLEAKENHFIICEVKTGSRGAPKIKEVVENGTLVKGPIYADWKLFGAFDVPTRLGDEIVVIDDSYLQEQAQNQDIAMNKAKADMIAAELLYPSKEKAITVAKENLEVAKQNKDKWVKGDYPQQLQDLEGKFQIADSNVLQQEDRASWAARMVKKTYMTASQLEAEQANLKGDQLQRDQLQMQIDVLRKYTNPTNLKNLDTAILIAETALTNAQNDERSAASDVELKRKVFEQQDALYRDLLDQIKQCRVRAPHSGTVVYYIPEQTRGGFGSNQSTIAQGEPVQYGQKMMTIPDLSQMVVNVRIHEASIGHMSVKARVERVVPGGSADKAGLQKGDVIIRLDDRPINAYNPDLVEALTDYKTGDKVKVRVLRDKKEMDLDLTFGDHHSTRKSGAVGSAGEAHRLFGATFQPGHPARVRVDAAGDRWLKAHVTSVATVAAQQDWMSPDVKVYPAYIQIDEPISDLKLKPGLSAVCEIFTETQAENVLAVPIQTIMPAKEVGGDPSVVVKTAKGTETRKIKLLKVDGKVMSDGTYIAVEEGLTEGDEVVENPKTATGDKDKKPSKDGPTGGPDGKADQPDPRSGKGKRGAPGAPPLQ